MPWLFNQRTGQLTHNGQPVTSGYSGKGPGKNNPAMQSVHDVGPTPLGTYSIGAPHHSAVTGNYSMSLSPEAGTNTFGRSALLIHGDNPKHIGQSSSGCIILPLAVRHSIWNSGDHTVQVTP